MNEVSLMAKVMITIKTVEGKCITNHQPGDSFIQENEITVGGLCSAAYNTLYPYIVAMLHDANLPYADKDGNLCIRCPDPENRVVFELKKTMD